MEVLAIHSRMAELCIVQKKRLLTAFEMDEMAILLQANVNYVWKMNKLKNLSWIASKTNDVDWKKEISERILALS